MKFFLLVFVILVATNLTAEVYHVGDHELFLMPTAYTMPKGTFYFSDYELFFLNVTGAPFDGTHLGVFTLFPITSDFLKTLTFGIKQNYYRSYYFSSAVFGSFTPDYPGFTLGNVLSIGTPKTSLHLALSLIDDFSGDTEPQVLFMSGIRYHVIILEYTNLKSWAEKDFDGIITFGFRFGGKKISWDIGGFRPINKEITNSTLILLPFLKATVHFGY